MYNWGDFYFLIVFLLFLNHFLEVYTCILFGNGVFVVLCLKFGDGLMKNLYWNAKGSV